MDIFKILKLFLRKWWLFALFALFAGGATYYVSVYELEPVYEANASIFVNDKEQNSAEYGIAYDQILVNTQLTADYTELMKSRTIAKAVIEDLGLENYTADMLTEMISVSPKNETRIIEITARSTDPETAMKVANSVAEVFSEKAVELMNVLNVNIVDRAEMPEFPVEPNEMRNTALAVLAGILLAAGIVLAMEYLDNTIKSAEDVENRLGLTVLGTIPEFRLK